uniref:TniQ family protein n=1 Tax=Burkholderia pseudomallei TaxID=28450 RepID=UPI0018763124
MRSATESRRLPLRLKPYDQESVRSYLARLAETYGYRTPRQFCKAVTERHGFTQADIRRALGLTTEEAARLQGWAPSYCPFFGHVPDGMTSEDF